MNRNLFVVSCLLFAVSSIEGMAQEINFGSYFTSSAELFVERNLSFGTIVSGDSKEVLIGSGDEAALSIEAIRFLDIFVTITAPAFVYLDGNDTCVTSDCRSQIIYSFAFNNTNTFLDNMSGNTSFGTSTVRLPMSRRGSGPPAPPPTPEIALVSLPLSTVYLYIGGEITTTGSETAGSFSNSVNIEIIYN
jgi:hypothetical protein